MISPSLPRTTSKLYNHNNHGILTYNKLTNKILLALRGGISLSAHLKQTHYLISQNNLTTVAVPQYGKYKVKAAHTEVKATLSNIHAAQALHMVDKNEYAPTLAAIDVPTPGGTYVFGNAANNISWLC